MNGDRLAAQVSARVDQVEVALERHGREIGAVKKDVDSLAVGMRALLKRQQADEKPQPDWLRMRDQQEAVALLQQAVAWHDQFLPWLDATLPPCWPWHSLAVVEVLGLAEQYAAAYDGSKPERVSDFLNRWLPSFRARSKQATAGMCNRNEHHAGGRVYDVDLGQVDALARWWAVERRGMPPGMKEKDQ